MGISVVLAVCCALRERREVRQDSNRQKRSIRDMVRREARRLDLSRRELRVAILHAGNYFDAISAVEISLAKPAVLEQTIIKQCTLSSTRMKEHLQRQIESIFLCQIHLGSLGDGAQNQESVFFI